MLTLQAWQNERAKATHRIMNVTPFRGLKIQGHDGLKQTGKWAQVGEPGSRKEEVSCPSSPAVTWPSQHLPTRRTVVP